jgi:hypothetical protein
MTASKNALANVVTPIRKQVSAGPSQILKATSSYVTILMKLQKIKCVL